MRGRRRVRIFTLPVVAGACLLVGCVTATPEQAHRAERECFHEARHEGYRRLEVSGTTYAVGETVILGMKARRHGEDFTGTCTFDPERRHADLSLSHAERGEDWMIEEARDECRWEAEERRYRVRDVSGERLHRDRVKLNMELRRHDRNYFARCHYVDGHAELDIERD